MCLGAIYWARFRHIYYGNTRAEAAAIGFDDDHIYREIGIDPGKRSIPATQLRPPGTDVPFAEWLKKPDKIRY